jgi:Family of unknown function (DUF6223)
MSVRHLVAAVDAVLLEGSGLAAPAAAPLSVAAGVIGSGRVGATVAGVVALIGVVVGGLALARSTGRTGNGRAGAVTALVLGLLGTGLAGLHLTTSTGGIGTGNGRAGAIVALVLGLIGVVLGGLALTRTRRTG